ncbi:MAG TPA: hypothetical protein DDY31_05940 [Lachnospiraceae bacterium]|nr:hypothetical protein [Lachnospiraceae bacterium]
MRADINGRCGVQDGGGSMEDKKYHYKVTEDGTVVLDQNDEVVVQCPTEQEAVEYIKEHGEKSE